MAFYNGRNSQTGSQAAAGMVPQSSMAGLIRINATQSNNGLAEYG
jgi:hypothetical protein